MVSLRKKDLAPASYPSARLVEWFRTKATVRLIAYKRQIVYGVSFVCFLAIVGGAWLGWRAYRTTEGLAHLRDGVLAVKTQDFDSAIDDFKKAEKALFGENRALAIIHLGTAYEQTALTTEAFEAYKRALSLSPSYLTQLALLRLGQGAEEAKAFDDAQNWYEKAAAMDGPLKGEALLALGETVERLGRDPEAAQLSYKRLLEEYPDYPMTEVVKEKVE